MTTQENRPLGTPVPGKYMLLRHGGTKKPVAYCTVPVPYAFKTMVEGFSR